MGTIQERTDEAKFQEFKMLLQRHDWWYMMSDDPTIYQRGYTQADRIKVLYHMLCGVDPTRTTRLYEAYCPYQNKKEPGCLDVLSQIGGME